MSEIDGETVHESVLRNEIVEIIGSAGSGLVIDATVGMGGHSEAILDAMPETQILGIDQDAEAVKLATKRLERFVDRVNIVNGNFAEIKEIVASEGLERPVAVFADLGISSLQVDSVNRGFSFRFDAPLDMRMDQVSDKPTAADLLAGLDEFELARIIYEYGEERNSRKIARWIVEKRKEGNPIKRTTELAELVRRATPASRRRDIHPATRTFQALRIAVNNELAILERFLIDSVELLADGGILAIISFHSLEDRIVKNEFRRMSGHCFCPPRIPRCACNASNIVEILTKKPIRPTENEIAVNPRSRSARLRACRKRNTSHGPVDTRRMK